VEARLSGLIDFLSAVYSRKTAGLATLRGSRLKTAKTNQGCAGFVIFSLVLGGDEE